MECRVCSDSLTAYIDGELNPSERAAVEVHMRECAGCSEEYKSLLYCVDLIDAVDSDVLFAPPFARVQALLNPLEESFWNFRWLLAPAWATVAATLLLAISIPFYLDSRDPEAHLERQFAQYVEERDRQEALHHGIIAAEPVGWVTYNPFSVERVSTPVNPFLE